MQIYCCKAYHNARFEVFKVINIQVEVFWVVIPCCDVMGYRRFGGLSSLTFQAELKWLKMDTTWSSETSVSYHITRWPRLSNVSL